MTYDIEIAEKPAARSRVVEVSRWEAGGRIFFQFAETQDLTDKLFRCNAILWDPMAEGLQLFAIDSAFGAHESHQITLDREGTTLRAVCTEKERVTEVVDVFSTGTKHVWSAGHDRLLLSIHSEGQRRPQGLQGAPGP
jgi:hypothetical protein